MTTTTETTTDADVIAELAKFNTEWAAAEERHRELDRDLAEKRRVLEGPDPNTRG